METARQVDARNALVCMAGELGPQQLRVLLDMTSIREVVLEELEEWKKPLLENNLHSGAIEMITAQGGIVGWATPLSALAAAFQTKEEWA